MPRSKNTTLTTRAREMHAVIESWQQSGRTQKTFCDEAGLALTTFQYWLNHYRDSQRGTPVRPEERSGFIALKAAAEPGTSSSLHACEIVWPNGVRLRLAALPEADLLQRLLALPVGR